MTMTFKPDAAANKPSETYDPMAQFDAIKFDAAVPDAMRAFAGSAVTETRKAYDRAKASLDAGMEAMQRSCDAASQAATALNRKIIDITQRNMNSGFDLAKSLASAKNLAEMVELQGAYWRKQFEVLMAQAEEVRALGVNATADMAEPIRSHAARQAAEVQALSSKVTAEAAGAIKRQGNPLQQELRKAS